MGGYSYTGMLEFLFQFLLSLIEFPLLIQLRAYDFTTNLQLSDYLGPLLHSVNNNALHNNNIITYLHIVPFA